MKLKLLFLAVLFALQMNAQQCWDKISSGAYHTIAIAQNGTLWGWGYNDTGQIGIGNAINQSNPIQIGTDNDWVSVGAGYYHSFAIKSNGTLWGWGSNGYRQIGLGATANYLTPQQVGTATNWLQVSGGERSSLGIKTDGTLWTWGNDGWEQMGNGLGGNHNSPTQVGTDSNWSQVDAGRYHCLALKTDGKIYAWGNNGYGQLSNGGFGATNSTPTLVTTTGTANFIKIEAGVNSSLAIKDDNSLWICGSVGPTNTNFFQQFAFPTTWVNVSAGTSHVVGVKSDGSLWAWGNNDLGQIAQPGFNSVNTPYQISGTNYSTEVSTNFLSSLVLKNDGSLYGSGQNHVGQLGDGSLIDKNGITAVLCPAVLSSEDFDQQRTITLFPNPTNDILTIEMDSKLKSVEIFNPQGQKIRIYNTKQITVSDLSSGIYLVRVEDENGSASTQKLIKQ